MKRNSVIFTTFILFLTIAFAFSLAWLDFTIDRNNALEISKCGGSHLKLTASEFSWRDFQSIPSDSMGVDSGRFEQVVFKSRNTGELAFALYENRSEQPYFYKAAIIYDWVAGNRYFVCVENAGWQEVQDFTLFFTTMPDSGKPVFDLSYVPPPN